MEPLPYRTGGCPCLAASQPTRPPHPPLYPHLATMPAGAAHDPQRGCEEQPRHRRPHRAGPLWLCPHHRAPAGYARFFFFFRCRLAMGAPRLAGSFCATEHSGWTDTLLGGRSDLFRAAQQGCPSVHRLSAVLPTGPPQPLRPSLATPSPAGPFTTLTEPTSSQIALGFGFFFGGLAQFCAGEKSLVVPCSAGSLCQDIVCML